MGCTCTLPPPVPLFQTEMFKNPSVLPFKTNKNSYMLPDVQEKHEIYSEVFVIGVYLHAGAVDG